MPTRRVIALCALSLLLGADMFAIVGDQPLIAGAAAAESELPPTQPTENLDPSFAPADGAAAPCGEDKLEEIRGGGGEQVEVACSLNLAPNTTITRKLRYQGSAASGATLLCRCDEAGCATLSGGISIAASGTDRPENITVRNCRITGDVRLEIPDTCPNARYECQGIALCPQSVPVGSSCESGRSECGRCGRCERVRSSCADTRPDFEEWIRARAPRRVTFDHVTIDGTGENRIYVGWGATETKLINSMIEGKASGVPIYLAPHSSGTLIKNNRIETLTEDNDREMISIDGSDHNRIIGNWFGGKLNHGGIFLFRNCGEKGSIRHTTPSHNQIINNAFRYVHYDGPNPAVFLGSRNGNPPGFEIDIPFIGTVGSYCDDDAGYPYGSSADDRDFATHNVVMQNDIIQRPLAGAIRSTNWVNNAMNLIDLNRTVERAPWPLPPAGCYVRGGAKEFILHGETTERFMSDDGSPICDRVTCKDGELSQALLTDVTTPRDDVVAPSTGASGSVGLLEGIVAPQDSVAAPTAGLAGSLCATRRVPIDCRITGDNNGCRQTVPCPAGTKVIGAVAACDLENGAVPDAELATVPSHLLHVARLSDDIEDGSCFVGASAVKAAPSDPRLLPLSWVGLSSWFSNQPRVIPRSAVQTHIREIAGRSSVEVGCKEYDENGGDCHIRGSLYCR
ncbi:MAG: right-handed parallel beta-helix repeat-containing protein [Pseudomonadota bacterium]|nr:right-handed parallel beta-helix repeat-containing protein [Pseudomonadota bacterium]